MLEGGAEHYDVRVEPIAKVELGDVTEEPAEVIIRVSVLANIILNIGWIIHHPG